MLVELAAANAAYATIKASIGAGRELVDCAGALGQYFAAKSELAKRVESKSGPKNELEEFLALEKLRHQEAELRQFMIYCGRGGMWEDWQQFQAQAARDRKEAVKVEARRKYLRGQALQENINLGIKVFGILFVVLAALFGVAIYLR